METKLLTIDPKNIDEAALEEAAQLLRRGENVAFPTETVYGLGGCATDEGAVRAIFAAKGRPADNPLIVHIWQPDQVYDYVRCVPENAKKLMEAFWGGPLTIIMKRKPIVPDCVTAGLDTVAIRLPSHPVAHSLLRLCGCGIAAPSANVSGRPSPTIARHVLEDLNGKISMVIDGGVCDFGIESTVIDVTAEVPTILRPGAVSLEEVRALLGEAEYGGGGKGVPKSPGMKYTHYSPKAEVFMVKDPAHLNGLAKGKNAGILAYNAENGGFSASCVLSAGKDNFEYAARLFYLLRSFDEHGVEVIYAQMPQLGGIGDGVYNRLSKAAGGRIL